MSPLLRYLLSIAMILAVAICGLGPAEAYDETIKDAVFKAQMDDMVSFAVRTGNRMQVVVGVLDEYTRIYDEQRKMLRAGRDGTPLELNGVWDVTLRYITDENDKRYARILRMEKVQGDADREHKTNKRQDRRKRAVSRR
jgi:hypothetical protein